VEIIDDYVITGQFAAVQRGALGRLRTVLMTALLVGRRPTRPPEHDGGP
jgi:hypothetical protein